MKSLALTTSQKSYVPVTIFVLLFAAYLPFTQSYLLVNDDYWGFVYDYKNYWDHPLFYDTATTIGRPLGAHLLAFVHYCISTVSSANILRGINIFLLAITGILFYLWLTLNLISPIPACIIAVALFTLPPFNFFISGVTGIVNVTGVLFATCSAFYVFKNSPETSSISRNVVLRLFVSITLLFASLVIYPVSSMFYWVMVAVVIVRIDYSDFLSLKRHIYLLLLAPFIALCGYFVYFKLIQDISPATQLSINLVGRLKWFAYQPLAAALDLWKIDGDMGNLWWMGAVVLPGFFLAGTREFLKKPKEASKIDYVAFVLKKWGLLGCLFPLSIFPILVTDNYVLSYRHLVALSPLVLLALIWAIGQIAMSIPLIKHRPYLLTASLAALCLYGVWSAHNNVQNYIIVPMSAELKYFKKIIGQYDPSEIKRIHVIVSTKFHRTHLTKIIESSLYEEFPGFQSTLNAPYHGAFNPALVLTAIKELAREDNRFAAVRKDWNIGHAVDAVTFSTKAAFDKQKISSDLKNTVVIDMTKIEFLIDSGEVANQTYE